LCTIYVINKYTLQFNTTEVTQNFTYMHWALFLLWLSVADMVMYVVVHSKPGIFYFQSVSTDKNKMLSCAVVVRERQRSVTISFALVCLVYWISKCEWQHKNSGIFILLMTVKYYLVIVSVHHIVENIW